MAYNLTEASLESIMSGAKIPSPVFQILGIKKLQSRNSNKERFRLVVSDGVYTVSHAILAAQNNEKILQVGDRTIIKVKRYITSTFNANSGKKQRILILSDVDIVAPGSVVSHQIGNPVQLAEVKKSEKSGSPQKSIMSSAEIPNPVFQILYIKKIQSGNSNKERFRLVVSDGVYTVSHAMLAAQNNKQILQAGYRTIIKVKRYITSRFNANSGGDKRILLLLDVDIVAPGSVVSHQIGNPVQLAEVKKNEKSSSPQKETAVAYNLTEGSLESIMSGAEIPNPVFQILGIKKIQSGISNKERFRLVVSDGVYIVSHAMWADQNNEKILQAGDRTVIKVKRYITSTFNTNSGKEQRILLLLDVDIVAPGSVVSHQIGNPVQTKNEKIGYPQKVQQVSSVKSSNVSNSNGSYNGRSTSLSLNIRIFRLNK